MVSSPGVTLRNAIIKGDLILGEAIGEGDVHLEGVTVEGNTVVNGGGENSVYFTDSMLAIVIVNKNTGAVRIVVQGSTQVFEVQLETPARVVEDELDEAAAGFEDIIVSEAMQSGDDGYQVQLEGEFETINSRASSIRINLSEATDIRTLILNAAAQVLGEGTVRTAEINANGSTLSQRPQNVVLDIDGSVTIEDEAVTESYSDETTTTSIKSIKANQGSISLEMENFVAGLTMSDFTVTAKVADQEYELKDLEYHPNQKRFTFDPIALTNHAGEVVEITVAPKSDKVAGEGKTASFVIKTGFAGQITDIQGVGIEGLTIKFREGTGTQEGEVVGEATTDRYGYYSVDLPAGTYTGEFSGPGYVTTYMIGTATSDSFLTDQNETAIRTAASSEVKIMLSWDKDPQDLDSHLIGPGADGKPFHIAYYNKKEIEDGITYVDLDWDDTDSYGPETTTIRELVDGEYRFYIHHFSGESTLRLSGAQVEVFKGNANTSDHTFNVPTGEGNEPYWVVFDLKVSAQGETVEIEPVNIMVDEENPRLMINDEETWGGFVSAGTKVELTTGSAGTKIYYTTGDTEPTLESTLYDGPIEITEDTVIKAVAVKEGVIVGYVNGHFKVTSLEMATEQVEAVEALVTDLDNVDEAEYAYVKAVQIVSELPASMATEEEKTALLSRLEAAKAVIDEARQTLLEETDQDSDHQDENEDGVISLDGIEEPTLLDIVTGEQYPLHHTGYSINEQEDLLVEQDERIEYIYVDSRETSIAGNPVVLEEDKIITPEWLDMSYSLALPEDKDSIDRFISIIYLDENKNPVAYQEELKTLNKADVTITDSPVILDSAIDNHIYVDGEGYLNFSPGEYYTSNEAKYMSIHYSDEAIDFQAGLAREENPYTAAEISTSTGRSFSKSTILDLLESETEPENMHAMIVLYDENFNTVAYGKRTFTKDEF